MLWTLLIACAGQVDIQTTDDVRDVCEAGTPTDVELSVTFEALDGGCPFGEDDNLDAQDATFSARIEQVDALELPEGGVVCDLDFDFQGLDPSFEQEMEYDDNFILTFNDVVLATSYGPLVDLLELDEDLRIYDWDAIAGSELRFQDIDPYCLGDEGGDSTCTIPDPETPGPIALSFGGGLVDQLSLRSVQQDRYDFSFISLGDNDDTDCSHRTFTFTVTAPVVEL